jgi:hypothetical protein
MPPPLDPTPLLDADPEPPLVDPDPPPDPELLLLDSELPLEVPLLDSEPPLEVPLLDSEPPPDDVEIPPVLDSEPPLDDAVADPSRRDPPPEFTSPGSSSCVRDPHPSATRAAKLESVLMCFIVVSPYCPRNPAWRPHHTRLTRTSEAAPVKPAGLGTAEAARPERRIQSVPRTPETSTVASEEEAGTRAPTSRTIQTNPRSRTPCNSRFGLSGQ